MIGIVLNTYQVDRYIHVCTHNRTHFSTLCNMNVVTVSLVRIHGHYNIYYNDLADLSAKHSIKDAYDIPVSSELTSDTCKRMIFKQ